MKFREKPHRMDTDRDFLDFDVDATQAFNQAAASNHAETNELRRAGITSAQAGA